MREYVLIFDDGSREVVVSNTTLEDAKKVFTGRIYRIYGDEGQKIFRTVVSVRLHVSKKSFEELEDFIRKNT